MDLPRTDRSIVGQWWMSIDRALLAALLGLIGTGIVVALAASPSVAIRKGLHPFYFAERQAVFAAAGLAIMLVVSMLTPAALRRLSLALFACAIAAMIVVLWTGDEINGARRWLRLWGFSLQPSELAKPAFAILVAWAFAERQRRPDMPALPVAIVLYAILVTLLVLQPDIGQTLLVTAVWVTLFLLTGGSRLWAVALAALGTVGLATAYTVFPHVRLRIHRFVTPTRGDNSQLDRAYQSFGEGGLLGRGPGEGTIKTVLPDAHTDFVFAVIAEEFGALACIGLVLLLAVVVIRPLLRAAVETEPFTRNAVVALALLFAFQALINLGSNVGLLPAKGMTLPFVSVGGSSVLAISVTCGMLIGLTRRRARVPRLNLPEMPVNAAPLSRTGV